METANPDEPPLNSVSLVSTLCPEESMSSIAFRAGPILPRVLSLVVAATVLGAAPVFAQTIVEAPAQAPGETQVLQAQEIWRVGGYGEEESDFFGYVSHAVVDDQGRVFLLDQQLCEVKAYDAEGNYLYKFGRKGEAPGEFERPRSLMLMPDGSIGVLHGTPPRIERFSPEGEIGETLSIGDPVGMKFILDAVIDTVKQIGTCTNGSGDHRDAAGHSLHHHQRHTLLNAGQKQQIHF